jgi:hypothetical protein
MTPVDGLDQPGFEEYASTIEVFLAGNFFYDRRLSEPGFEEPCQGAVAFRAQIRACPPDPGMLVTLLRHSDPKVRTLAMAALFDREERRYLPDIASLANDTSITFPAIVPPVHKIARRPARPPDWWKAWSRQQTVAKIARMFALIGAAPLRSQHGALDSPAAWVFFRLQRATQGQSPIDPARIPKIQAIRREVEALPQPERAWTFLLLRWAPMPTHCEGPSTLILSRDLAADLKTVNREDLLRLLCKEKISDDPAIQSGNNDMCLFVLEHAQELLRPADAEWLLEREQWERNHLQKGNAWPLISPWWAIAAANLNPGTAANVLKAAWSRFGHVHGQSDRGLLAQALWRTAGKTEMRQVVDWFYDDTALKGLSDGRSAFWGQLSKTPQAGDVELVRALVADRRLDRLEFRDLQELIYAANRFTNTPLVTQQEFRDTYPVIAGMYRWRQRLRAAFPPR